MFYNFDRNSRAFTLHYIFDKFLKMSVISRKEVYFGIVDPPVYFKYVKNIGRKGLTEKCHTQLIHRKTYSLEIHIYQTKTRAGYSMSYVSFHSFMQVYFLCNCLYPNSMNGSLWISFIMWCVFKSNIARDVNIGQNIIMIF